MQIKRQQDFNNIKYKDITVYYTPALSGGGGDFGQEFLWAVRNKIGKVEHICEFGSGPGYIGFSLLAHGLCNKLTLVDINPEAIEMCRKTIRANKLEDKVSAYVSDCFDNVPDTERWDLVVSNPPHFPAAADKPHMALRQHDPGWMVHKKFYRDVGKHLKPGASILFQENKVASTVWAFKQMIEESNLTIVDVFQAKHSFVAYMKPVLKFKHPVRRYREWRSYGSYFIQSKLKSSCDKGPAINLYKLQLWH